jgi:hypothetical protein
VLTKYYKQQGNPLVRSNKSHGTAYKEPKKIGVAGNQRDQREKMRKYQRANSRRWAAAESHDAHERQDNISDCINGCTYVIYYDRRVQAPGRSDG